MAFVDLALQYRSMGLHPIVEGVNSKAPIKKGWEGQVYAPDKELRELFGAAPAGHGIGTVTGEGFIVVDLDVGEGKNGLESVKTLPPLPRTLTSITRSGGRHHFFRIPAGVTIRNSVSKLAPGVDIRGTGGQVVLPPTVIDGAPYTWDVTAPNYMADLPASWLSLLQQDRAPGPEGVKPAGSTPSAASPSGAPVRQRIRKAADVAFEADRRARYMATLTDLSVQGQGGNAVMMRAAFHAKEMSRNVDEALDALVGWNLRCAEPVWARSDLTRAIENSEAVYGAGLDREKEPADAAALGAQVFNSAPVAGIHPAEPEEEQAEGVAWVESMQAYVAQDRASGVWQLEKPLSIKGAEGALVRRGRTASEARAILKDWLLVNAARVDCDPARPPTFMVDDELVLNNYVPPLITPREGAFPTIDEIITFIAAGDLAARKWLVNWFAFAIQNPARPMRTVPVLFGAQRTGKSLLARLMTTLMGERNCAAIRNEDVKGRFTSHFVTKLFVTVGEIEAGEVAHATSTLKHLTGEPTLVFEAKGSAAFPVVNRIKMMATSNQTLPVTVEGEGDTRWVLLKQMATPGAEYTARMLALFDRATNDWSEQGRLEVEAFAHFLLNYPVDVDLAFSVHTNEARSAAVEASRNSVEQFVESVRGSSLDAVWLSVVPEYERNGPSFNQLDLPGGTLTGAAAMYATYRAFCRASGLLPLGTGRFPGEMARYASDWPRTRAATSVCETRPWVYRNAPRNQKLRMQYVPLEMRQKQLSLSDAKRGENDVLKTAVSNFQTAFGENQ
jgi:hypothetical protein